jgi:hypothetical protein
MHETGESVPDAIKDATNATVFWFRVRTAKARGKGRDDMPETQPNRKRLTPWYIGLAVVLAAVIYIAYQWTATECPAPGFIEFGVLVILPVIYLVLMYLTLTSQR